MIVKYKFDEGEIINNDCLETMKHIPDKTVDMILCDLPYNKLTIQWDKLIPMDKLWEQYKRIIKDNGAIVLFAQQPFTSLLVVSNIDDFRHNIVWHKDKCANFIQAKYQPRKTTEDILVFSKQGSGFSHNSKNKCTYNPQMIDRKPRDPAQKTVRSKSLLEVRGQGCDLKSGDDFIPDKSYPKNIVYFKTEHKNRLHPCQKPIKLLEYLIKTYTNENEIILDNCAGSMSTFIASINTNRRCIAIEKDEMIFKKGVERVRSYINTQ